jgi:hypothetical protein
LVGSIAFQDAVPRYFGAAVFFGRFRASGEIENQSPAVAKGDFFGLPTGSLVEAVRVGVRWITGTVEPIEIRFPQAVEAKGEFVFLAADDLANRFHRALAAGALERIAAPNLEDEVAPEGTHVTGGLLWRPAVFRMEARVWEVG